MGYGLLYESMLPSVLDARDRFMAPGGTMWPNKTRLLLTGWSDRGVDGTQPSRMGWWGNVHGLDMSCLAPLALQDACIEVVPVPTLVTPTEAVWKLDLNTCSAADLDFEAPFTLTAESRGLCGMVLSFDVGFEAEEATVVLTTSPEAPPTHWKQTLLVMDPQQLAAAPEASRRGLVTGTLAMRRRGAEQNHRDYDIALKWEFQGGAKGAQVFALAT